MTTKRRDISIMRDLGAALAVTAIWLLSLLAPAHQASGLLRDLAEAGYEPAVVWSLCDPAGAGDDADDSAKMLCPAQGIAKSLIFVVFAAALGLIFAPILGLFRAALRSRAARAPPDFRSPQPRAPPFFA